VPAKRIRENEAGMDHSRGGSRDAAKNKLRARRAKKLRIIGMRQGLARHAGRSRKRGAVGWIDFFRT